jgi:hypothetical protein
MQQNQIFFIGPYSTNFLYGSPEIKSGEVESYVPVNGFCAKRDLRYDQ